jgi:serine/threonine protein kinase
MNPIEVLRKSDGKLVITDFGISVSRLIGQLKSTSRCRASPETCALELMKEHPTYDEHLDIWAAGGVAHFVATGTHLFPPTKSYADLTRLYERLEPTISAESKLLIDIRCAYPLTPNKIFDPIQSQALQLDPKMRATAADLLALTKGLALGLDFGMTYLANCPRTQISSADKLSSIQSTAPSRNIRQFCYMDNPE